MTKDYSIKLQDSTGRIVTLFINGASIDEMGGDAYARESIESDAFQSAIAEGSIGSDAYLID